MGGMSIEFHKKISEDITKESSCWDNPEASPIGSQKNAGMKFARNFVRNHVRHSKKFSEILVEIFQDEPSIPRFLCTVRKNH